MYWASPLLARAVALELVEPSTLSRLARRVRSRARDLPSSDLVWVEELVRSRAITRYQALALLSLPEVSRTVGELVPDSRDARLEIGPYVVCDRIGKNDLGTMYRCRLRGTQDAK